jgi:hypothetical protein
MKKLTSQLEYEVTCEKLADLQQWYEEAKSRQTENPHAKEMTLLSLGHLIKQLQEEKIWYECHTGQRNASAPPTVPAAHAGGASEPCTN